MEHPELGMSYRALVKHRRNVGDARYGTRHLQRTDLAANRVQEAADTVVYLTLTARAWTAAPHTRPPEMYARLASLARDAGALGERCATLTNPYSAAAFGPVLRARFQYGTRRYGDSYLGRENLWEALEELADCEILVALDRERHAHLSETRHPHDGQLREITGRCRTLGALILALRGELTSNPPGTGTVRARATEPRMLEHRRAPAG
jgi:hypothetical protein